MLSTSLKSICGWNQKGRSLSRHEQPSRGSRKHWPVSRRNLKSRKKRNCRLTSLQLEEMPELLFLGAEITGGIFCRINFDRYSFNNLQSGFFKRLELQRIIRDDSHFAESKIEKYLRTLPVIPQVYRQTKPLICFHGISALVL